MRLLLLTCFFACALCASVNLEHKDVLLYQDSLRTQKDFKSKIQNWFPCIQTTTMTDLDSFLKTNGKIAREVRDLTSKKDNFLVKLREIYENFEENNLSDIREGIDICIKGRLQKQFNEDEEAVQSILSEIKKNFEYKAEFLFDMQKLDQAIVSFVKKYQESQPTSVYNTIESKLYEWYPSGNSFIVGKFIEYLKTNEISLADIEGLEEGDKESFSENHFVRHFADTLRVDEGFTDFVAGQAEIYIKEKHSNDSDYVFAALEEIKLKAVFSGESLFDSQIFQETLEVFVDDYAELFLSIMIKDSLSDYYENDDEAIRDMQKSLTKIDDYWTIFEMKNIATKDDIDKVLMPIVESIENVRNSQQKLVELVQGWYEDLDESILELLTSYIEINIEDLSVLSNLSASKGDFSNIFIEKYSKDFVAKENCSDLLEKAIKLKAKDILDSENIPENDQKTIIENTHADLEFLLEEFSLLNFLQPFADQVKTRQMIEEKERALGTLEESIYNWFSYLSKSTLQSLIVHIKSQNLDLEGVRSLSSSKESFLESDVLEQFCKTLKSSVEIQTEIKSHAKIILLEISPTSNVNKFFDLMDTTRFNYEPNLMFIQSKLVENIKPLLEIISLDEKIDKVEEKLLTSYGKSKFSSYIRDFVGFLRNSNLSENEISEMLEEETFLNSRLMSEFYEENKINIDRDIIKAIEIIVNELNPQNQADILDALKVNEYEEQFSITFLLRQNVLEKFINNKVENLIESCTEEVMWRIENAQQSNENFKCISKEFCTRKVVFKEILFETLFKPYLGEIAEFFKTDENSQENFSSRIESSLKKSRKIENFEVECVVKFLKNNMEKFFDDQEFNDVTFESEIDSTLEKYSNFFAFPENFKVEKAEKSCGGKLKIVGMWWIYLAYFLILFIVNALDAVDFSLRNF